MAGGETEDGAQTGGDEIVSDPTVVGAPSTESFARAPWRRRKRTEVQRSPLVGFMSVPVHPKIPIRRSTLLMAVAFLGFGTLMVLYPAQSTARSDNGSGGSVVPGVVPASTSTTTTTTTSTTTTTTPTTSTTPTSTTRSPGSTTTTRPTSTTTSSSSPASTTTGGGPGGSGSSTGTSTSGPGQPGSSP